ncbi:hypothetical protein B0H19DRAFT_1174206 [Mycena capillaripes]|nr:hypothetical protein B0H19DRAFT_1174206 [Mycena capillaripes]
MMHAFRCSECGAFSNGSGPPVDDAFDLAVAPGTPHHVLLNTNEPPADSEIIFTQSVISKTDAHSAYLDDKILKLQDKLKLLEEERASLRVPPEVLGQIFSWTLPEIDNDTGLDRFDMGTSPWVLTHISARWRAISLSTPSLWSRVVVDCNEISSFRSRYLLSQVETQIERSQKLEIHFYGSDAHDIRSQIQMFDLLSQHSERWEVVFFELTSSMVPLLAGLQNRISSLKRLWIQWANPESQSLESIDCFQTAPLLVDVTIYNEYHSSISVSLPALQLTRYNVEGPWKMHKHILKLTRNLAEARIIIDADTIEDPWPDSGEIVDVLRLRRLYVTELEVLNYLKVPALDEIGLWLSHDDGQTALTGLRSLIDRSSCCLRRLCLRGYPTAQTVSDILQKCSSITELVILNAADTSDEELESDEIDELLAALTMSPLVGATVIAPHLSLMIFGCEDGNYLDYTAYLEMLESRWKAENCALKAAALLTEGPGPDPATYWALRTLGRDGLELSLMEGEDARDEIDRLRYAPTW